MQVVIQGVTKTGDIRPRNGLQGAYGCGGTCERSAYVQCLNCEVTLIIAMRRSQVRLYYRHHLNQVK